jgi:hypothetical protein
MSSAAEYYREQAARCRRLAAHVLDRDLQQRLLDLAAEYEQKAAAPPPDEHEECPQEEDDCAAPR